MTAQAQRHERALAESVTLSSNEVILSDMPAPLEVTYDSNFLVPNITLVVALVVTLVVFGLLVVWPLVETVVRQQWGYTLGVILLGPIGGLVWFFVGRHETAHRLDSRANRSAA